MRPPDRARAMTTPTARVGELRTRTLIAGVLLACCAHVCTGGSPGAEVGARLSARSLGLQDACHNNAVQKLRNGALA
eukprot:2118886-Lingulodinium_polyedra.AAC.1